MRANLANMKNKRQLESILLVCVLVATSMVVVFPLTAPKAKAVVHLANADLEDGDITYDMDGVKNGIVLWDQNQDHVISNPMGYVIQDWMTLNIPPLNYQIGDPAENVIEFQGMGSRIDVLGTLITTPANPTEYTAFTAGGATPWDGIYFWPGSQGVFEDVLIQTSTNGIVMEPGSSLISPGVARCRFEDIQGYGMQMDGVTGYTNIGDNTSFYDFSAPVANGIGLDVQNGSLDLSWTIFNSHGPGLPSLHINNADVNVNVVQFYGNNQPGYGAFVEGTSNGTVFENCGFWDGVADNHYIRADGSSFLINNDTFELGGGQLTVIANDNASAISAHPILRNPNPPGTTFDNTTIDATGGSSVILQWYKNVGVEDPLGNPIENSLVRIEDRLKNPAQPPVMPTDVIGWARGIIVTELIQYAAIRDVFNPFNVSAENATMFGYIDPEETISMSMTNNIIVPFNPVPNTPPIVSQIDTPFGVQSGLVTIQFRLEDIDIGDDGNLSITVEFWDPTGGMGWTPATADPSSDTTDLNVGILYTFVWDSRADFPDGYSTEIKINITPHDKAGPGTPSETLTFTVDNKAPEFLSGPVVTPTNNSATITWTVDENADAVVWYGLNITDDPSDLIYEQANSTGTTSQVVDITNLKPGRIYSFVINSTDSEGNKRSSMPTGDSPYQLETEIHIQLKKGWNMISIPPITPSSPPPTIGSVLAPIAGLYDAVQAYDVTDTNDPWKHNRIGKLYGNDLDTIGPPTGLWIHMKQDALFILDHRSPAWDQQEWIVLSPGWNFVGYPSVENRARDTALAGVPYDMVQTYNENSGMWDSWDTVKGNLDTMEMGKGYWIHVTTGFLWIVTYADP